MGDVYEQNIAAQNRKIFVWIHFHGASSIVVYVDVVESSLQKRFI
jgi:uncharacterized protein YpiB (UPF0302 family)